MSAGRLKTFIMYNWEHFCIYYVYFRFFYFVFIVRTYLLTVD